MLIPKQGTSGIDKRKYTPIENTRSFSLIPIVFSDLSVSVGAMVFNAIQVILNGHWLFSMWLCDIYNAMDVVFSTASILNLFCISMYRLVTIKFVTKLLS